MVAMKTKLMISAVGAVLLVVSCNGGKTEQDVSHDDSNNIEEYVAVLCNTIDLDSVAGTYRGVLPPGIETELTLRTDGSYHLKQKSKNSDGEDEVLNGVFKVINGDVLMLEHPKSGDNIFYKVKNDSCIILIDSFGNEPKRSDAKYYVLKRM